MTIQFVSIICDLYKDRDYKNLEITPKWSEAWLDINFRLNNLKKLIDADIPLILFAEPNIIPADWQIPDHVKVIEFTLDNVSTFQKIISSKPMLPASINTPKDTLEYFALMNSKLEFIEQARVINPSADIYCWIDCGIFKFINDVPGAYRQLRAFELIEMDRAFLSPSGSVPAWSKGSYIPEYVYWRFLGSMFFVKADQFDNFKNLSDQILQQVLQTGKITWEVNVWALLESFCPDLFRLYPGDHNDSIFDIERIKNAT